MKKVLLIPGNTDLNRGDQALVWESIKLINNIYDYPEIILMRGDDYRQYAQTERLGYNFVENILRHPSRIIKNNHIRYSVLDLVLEGFRAGLDLIITSLLLVPCNFINRIGLAFLPAEYKKTYKTFSECDAVFVKGGGFIHSYGSIIDPYQMYFLLYNMLLGIRYKKKVIVLPNSIGPLKNKIAAWLADYTLNRCSYVSVRESVSKKYLNERKSIRIPVFRHSDLGYYLKSSDFDSLNYLTNLGVNMAAPKVAITLRPYRFPGSDKPKELYNTYLNVFVKFIASLTGKGYQVALCAHTLGPGAHENDSLAIIEVANKLRKNQVPFFCICDESLTCQDVMALYSRFDYLVGTRFHSVIFAQNMLVPTIAITYGGNKGVGIMEDLSLSEYSISMANISYDGILEAFEKLVSNRSIVLNRMKQNKQRLMDDRKDIISEIKSVCIGE